MFLKDEALINLRDFKEIMDEFGWEWWVSDGTALGFYRDGDLIKNDYDDIDVSLWKKYAVDSESLKKRLLEKDFFIVKDWKYLDGTSEGMAVKRNGNKIDIIFNSRKKVGDKEVVYYLADNSKKKFGNGEVYAYVFPAEYFNKIGTVYANGEYFPIPMPTKQYLESHYGKNWNVPILRGEGYKPHSTEQNPCLRANWEWDNPEHML